MRRIKILIFNGDWEKDFRNILEMLSLKPVSLSHSFLFLVLTKEKTQK